MDGLESKKKQLVRILKTKQVLIVLDNISDSNQLSHLIPEEAPNVTFLITSRDHTLVKHFAKNTKITLTGLSLKETKDLFSVAQGKQYVDKNLKNIEEILALSSGYPLALAIMATDEFVLLDTYIRELKRLNIKFLFEGDSFDVHKFLELSFESVQPELKQIFKFAGTIPGVVV